MYQLCSFATFGNFEVNKNSQFWQVWGASMIGMPDIARIGETVTQVLYREAKKLFTNFCNRACSYHFWQQCTTI